MWHNTALYILQRINTFSELPSLRCITHRKKASVQSCLQVTFTYRQINSSIFVNVTEVLPSVTNELRRIQRLTKRKYYCVC